MARREQRETCLLSSAVLNETIGPEALKAIETPVGLTVHVVLQIDAIVPVRHLAAGSRR